MIPLVLAVLLPPPSVASIVVLWLGGAIVTWMLARRVAGDSVAAAIVLGGFVARGMLGAALYEVSARSLPLFGDLQLGNGFWSFAPDSLYIHQWARGAAIALRAGLGLPAFAGLPDYPFLVAAAYRWLGAHPLDAIFLQACAGVGTCLMGFVLARSLWGLQRARIAVALIAFWPSLVLWSTQLLKESLSLFLVLAFITGFQRFARASGGARMAWGVEMIVTIVVVHRLRLYLAFALAAAVMVVIVIKLLLGAGATGRRDVPAYAILSATLVVALWGGSTYSPEWLGRPSNGPGHHKRLAAYMICHGNLDDAVWQLTSAAAEEASDAGRAPAWLEVTQRGRAMFAAMQAELAQSGACLARPATRSNESPTAFTMPRPGATGVDEPIRPYDRTVGFGVPELNGMRMGYTRTGGASMIDADVVFTDVASVIRYLPRALVNATVTPNPFTSFRAGGPGEGTRRLAMIEIPLVVLVLLAAVSAIPAALARVTEMVILTVSYSAILATLLGLVVTNVGIMFRLRLGFLLPLFILAVGAGATRRPARARGNADVASSRTEQFP